MVFHNLILQWIFPYAHQCNLNGQNEIGPQSGVLRIIPIAGLRYISFGFATKTKGAAHLYFAKRRALASSQLEPLEGSRTSASCRRSSSCMSSSDSGGTFSGVRLTHNSPIKSR